MTKVEKSRGGGPLIKEWPGFFLRDDSAMRDYLPENEREAYSLFREEPYGREVVLCGSLEWAITEAESKIQEILKDES